MSSQQSPLPEELQAALEDVRQVRDTLGKLRMTHPIRDMMRPLQVFSIVMGPVLLVYGIIMQRMYDTPGSQIFGLSKTTFVWIATLLLVVVSGVIKGMLVRKASADLGYSYTGLLNRVLWDDGYIRIIAAVFPMIAILIATFIHIGHAYQIPGLIMLFTGAITILIPLAFPLQELTRVGVFSLVAGGASMFVYPEFPFYKAGILFGVMCIILGVTPIRSSNGAE